MTEVAKLTPPAVAGMPDDRNAARTMALFREAALQVGERVGLCVVRNLSAGGAMIRTEMPLGIDDPVILVMSSGRRAAGRIRWKQDKRAGIAFDAEMSLAWLLDRYDAAPDGSAVRRLPRVPVAVAATIAAGGGYVDTTTTEISTHGIRVAAGRGLAIGPVTVELAGFDRLRGRLLWIQDGQAGCVFDHPLPIDALTNWLSLQEVEGGIADGH